MLIILFRRNNSNDKNFLQGGEENIHILWSLWLVRRFGLLVNCGNFSTQLHIADSGLSPSSKKKREGRRGGDIEGICEANRLFYLLLVWWSGLPLKEPRHDGSFGFVFLKKKRKETIQRIQKKKKEEN